MNFKIFNHIFFLIPYFCFESFSKCFCFCAAVTVGSRFVQICYCSPKLFEQEKKNGRKIKLRRKGDASAVRKFKGTVHRF